MKNDRPRFAIAQPKPPLSETSELSRFERLTVPTTTFVVFAVASCWNWIGIATVTSGIEPCVVSTCTPQSPATGMLTGMSVAVLIRARTVTSSSLAPCFGASTRRGESPGYLLRSMSIGPHGFFGLPPGQQIGVEPPQLAGTL